MIGTAEPWRSGHPRGKVLRDVVGHPADLPPDDLLAGIELCDLRVDLRDRPAVLHEVENQIAKRLGLPLRHLVDGDVDVERLLLEPDHVMAGKTADAHEHAEHEQDHARRQVREERDDRRMHDPGDERQDRQVHVRADPGHGSARHDLLAERGSLAERIERAGRDEQQRCEDAEPDDKGERDAARRLHVALDVEEPAEADGEDQDRADDSRNVPLARRDLKFRRTSHPTRPPRLEAGALSTTRSREGPCYVPTADRRSSGCDPRTQRARHQWEPL